MCFVLDISFHFLVHPGATPGRASADGASDKPGKEGPPRGFRELREALKILQSLKNMTVEQLWTGGSPTSPTSVESAAASLTAGGGSVTPAGPEKPTKEQRFLDDIKKLQETLKKTLDNVAIVEEEKMEAVVEAGGSAGGAGAAEVSVRWTLPLFIHSLAAYPPGVLFPLSEVLWVRFGARIRPSGLLQGLKDFSESLVARRCVCVLCDCAVCL